MSAPILLCGDAEMFGRPKQDKRTLYVGGLDEDVGVEILRAAFIPFGEVGIQSVFKRKILIFVAFAVG